MLVVTIVAGFGLCRVALRKARAMSTDAEQTGAPPSVDADDSPDNSEQMVRTADHVTDTAGVVLMARHGMDNTGHSAHDTNDADILVDKAIEHGMTGDELFAVRIVLFATKSRR